MALYRMIESDTLPGWASDTRPDGSRMTHGALFVAAGQVPVTLRGEKIAFDRESFLQRAFQEAKNEPPK